MERFDLLSKEEGICWHLKIYQQNQLDVWDMVKN